MLTILLMVALLFGSALAAGAKENSAEFYIKRGIAHGKKGELDRAITDFNKALKINPRDVRAYLSRGVAYGKKDQHDQAIADFTAALKIDPKLAKAYFGRAIAYTSKKDFDKAWEDVHKAQSLGAQIPQEFLEVLRQASGRNK
jgi:tetratricopeptide (TPR) repeat protein